jgi:phosphoribosylformylglycinamidine cyclo-ligase
VSDGCVQADCALMGGETAIMGDLYARGDYDLAGFCVGVVERSQVIDGKSIAPGDKVIGIASSGVHSNGFSLVRRVVFELNGFGADDYIDELGGKVGDVLLAPTKIYASAVRKVLRNYKRKSIVHGIAHITGGGLFENLSRILPPSVDVEIERGSWKIPPVFSWLQRLGDIDESEMMSVFNQGIGLAMIVSPYYVDSIRRMLDESGCENWLIGEVTAADPGARKTGEVAWKK